MKHLDDKYFVPFPEFFKQKDYDSEMYLGIDFKYENIPISTNIIFTKSENLEEIKKAAKKDHEETEGLGLSMKTKLAIDKIHEKLSNEEPSEPRFKLEFKPGKKHYEFSEKEKILTIFIEHNSLPITEKIFFFPADMY